ncbi:MAG: O-antigen ligase family protein [Parvularculaceae bacterium]
MKIQPAEGWSWARRMIALGMLLVFVQEFRPLSVLFTYSDFFFILGGALLIAGRGVASKPFGSFTHYWYLAFAVMIGFLLASSLVNGSAERGFIFVIQYVFAFAFLPFILHSETSERWRNLVTFMLVGLAGMELFTLGVLIYHDFNYLTLLNAFGPLFYSGNGRVGALVGNPNTHSAMLCMALPFVYYFRLRGWMPLWAFVAMMTIIIGGIVFSASATGTATAILVSLVFAVIARLRPSPGFFAVTGLVAAGWLVAGAPLPRAFEARVAPAISSGNVEEAGTFTSRVELMEEAWAVANETTVLGLGADQFRTVSDHGAPVHNAYLLMWTEGGFLAFLGWTGLVLILFICPLRMVFRRPLEAALGLATMTAFFIFSQGTTAMYARMWTAVALLSIAPAVALQTQLFAQRQRAAGYKRFHAPSGAPEGARADWAGDAESVRPLLS